MSELDRSAGPPEQAPALAPAPNPVSEAPLSFGPALATARQARSWSVTDVAARLRLQTRQVQAIEAQQLDALPQGAFVRGFVRNYAKEVGLDPTPLLADLNGRLKPTEPLRVDGPGAAALNPVQLAAREHDSRAAVMGGAVAALLLFAIAGWLALRPLQPTLPTASINPRAPVVPAPVASAEQILAGISAAPVNDATPGAPAALDGVAGAANGVGGPAADGAADSEPPLLPPDALHFSFREPSWVEITQADGKVLLSRLNDAGSVRTVVGAPPYAVIVGNASMVELEFRGKRVDLAGVASRENVARLRLE